MMTYDFCVFHFNSTITNKHRKQRNCTGNAVTVTKTLLSFFDRNAVCNVVIVF